MKTKSAPKAPLAEPSETPTFDEMHEAWERLVAVLSETIDGPQPGDDPVEEEAVDDGADD